MLSINFKNLSLVLHLDWQTDKLYPLSSLSGFLTTRRLDLKKELYFICLFLSGLDQYLTDCRYKIIAFNSIENFFFALPFP